MSISILAQVVDIHSWIKRPLEQFFSAICGLPDRSQSSWLLGRHVRPESLQPEAHRLAKAEDEGVKHAMCYGAAGEWSR